LGPILNFPEFDLVCRLGLQPYRARAGRSKSGPSRQTRSNATFRVKIEISGPKLENYNTLTPLNLIDIGIESIFGAYQGKHSRTDYPSGKVTARREQLSETILESSIFSTRGGRAWNGGRLKGPDFGHGSNSILDGPDFGHGVGQLKLDRADGGRARPVGRSGGPNESNESCS